MNLRRLSCGVRRNSARKVVFRKVVFPPLIRDCDWTLFRLLGSPREERRVPPVVATGADGRDRLFSARKPPIRYGPLVGVPTAASKSCGATRRPDRRQRTGFCRFRYGTRKSEASDRERTTNMAASARPPTRRRHPSSGRRAQAKGWCVRLPPLNPATLPHHPSHADGREVRSARYEVAFATRRITSL